MGKGLLTNMCGSVKSKADIIPVDIVSNALIVAASHRANLKWVQTSPLQGNAMRVFTSLFRADVIPVIHVSSGALNPLKWGRIVNYLQQFYLQYPLDQCYRVPSTQFHSTRTMFLINFYLKHYCPAYALDVLCRVSGRNPMYFERPTSVPR